MQEHILKKIILFSLILIGFSVVTFAQSHEIVASIGDEQITVDQFKTRFEFTPHIGRHIKVREEALKQNFLHTIIAEKLWASKAIAKGFDEHPIIHQTLKAIKKMFVRDQLYREEILSKVSISDEELTYWVEREITKLNLLYLAAKNKDDAEQLYYLLTSGYDFTDLLKTRPEFQAQDTSRFYSHEEIDASIIDSLYQLDVGQFSKPIYLDGSWYIYYLRDKQVQMFANSEGSDSPVTKAKEIIKERKADELYKNFMEDLFVGKNIKVNGKLFRHIASKFSNYLETKPAIYDTLFIDSNDAFKLVNQFADDTLKMDFIMLDNEPVSVSEFIYEIAFYNFETSSTDVEIISRDLNAQIRQIIEYEILAREGMKRGLDEMEEVKNSFDMWRDYYLSSYYKNSFKDSVAVNEEEIAKELQQRANSSVYNRYEYKILELLTDDLEKVRIALTIEDENLFRQYAAQNTKRIEAKANNGELGWFNSQAHPKISKILDNLNSGDVYGPIDLDEGYSVVWLIGKRSSKDSLSVESKLVKQQIRESVKEKKYSELLLKNTVKFANELGININLDVLKKIQVSQINSYLIRVIGFGGSIPAVPLSQDFSDWVEYYYNQDKISL